jgi:tetratricopeptide (TPR) repeat protein
LAEDDTDILSDIWYNIGNIYIVMGDLEMAVQAFNLSLQYLPDNTEALNNLAVISDRQGNTDWAINYA